MSDSVFDLSLEAQLHIRSLTDQLNNINKSNITDATLDDMKTVIIQLITEVKVKDKIIQKLLKSPGNPLEVELL